MSETNKPIVMPLHFYNHEEKKILRLVAFAANVSQQEYVREAIREKIQRDAIADSKK